MKIEQRNCEEVNCKVDPKRELAEKSKRKPEAEVSGGTVRKEAGERKLGKKLQLSRNRKDT